MGNKDFLLLIKDLLDFISSLVNSLAWPVAIVILVFIFRSPLQKLLEGLTRLRYGELEMNFKQEMQNIKDQATTAGIELEPKTTPAKTTTRDSAEIITDALKLVEEFPEPAVVLAWTAVEHELLQVGLRFDIPTSSRGYNPPGRAIRFLREHGQLESEACDILDRMRILRNAAAHTIKEKVRISSDEATEFVYLTGAMTERLKSLRPDIKR